MRRLRMPLLVVFVASISTLGFVGDAHACSGPLLYLCTGAKADAAPAGAQLIAFTTVPETVGENFSLVPSTKTPIITLTDASDTPIDTAVSADANIPGVWLVKPTTALAAGATYKVKWEPICTPELGTPDTPETTVTVPADAPAPTALGTLTATAPTKREYHPSSCDNVGSYEYEVVSQVTLAADPSFQPWAKVAKITTLIDGLPLKGNPSSAMEIDFNGFFRASCDPKVSTGITPAPHTIMQRAYIAGSPTPLTAEVQVDFTCAGGETAVGVSDPSANATPSNPAPSEGSSSCAMSRIPASSALPISALALSALSIVLAARRRSPRS